MKTSLFLSSLAAFALLPLSSQGAFPAGANNFASAAEIILNDDNNSPPTDLFGYTMESGELSHNPRNTNNSSTFTGGKSAWWKWTPTVSGFCAVDTTATITSLSGLSPIQDTVLSVYTGTALNALTRIIASDNHGSSAVNADHMLAKVSFYAVAGTTYYIAVDGSTFVEVNNTRRNVMLRLRQLEAVAQTRRALWVMSNNNALKQGMLTVTLTATGRYSATLQAGATIYRFTGIFDTDGTSLRPIARVASRGAPLLTPIMVRLDARGRGHCMIEIDGEFIDGSLKRQMVFPTNAPAAVAGNYNVAERFDFSSNSNARGYQKVSISSKGVVTAVGVTVDGVAVTTGSFLLDDNDPGYFTFYAYRSQQAGKGSFILDGSAEVGATDPEDALEISTSTLRPAITNAIFMPTGLTAYEDMRGRKYVKPALNARALPTLSATSGIGELTVYEMPGEISNRVIEAVTLSTLNRFTFGSLLRKPTLTLNLTTGLVTGKITTTDTILGVSKPRVRTLRGILFTDDNGDSHILGQASGITSTTMFRVEPVIP